MQRNLKCVSFLRWKATKQCTTVPVRVGGESTRSFGCRTLICIVRLGVGLAAGLFVVNFKVGELFYGHQPNYRQKLMMANLPACQLQRYLESTGHE